MCNLAGYVGDDRAAPVLLEMMARQEGFAGGYYSGIATIADGKLHHAKVVGDVATLRQQTDAGDLPGTVGIAHSRSKSGGDVEWAHPFLDCAGRMAYVANGHGGCLQDEANRTAVAQRLADAGHGLRSRAQGAIGSYPVLTDGTCVHMSDVMCHLIESLVDECGSPSEAMRCAFMAMPAEIVGLMVHEDMPDCVVASRFNQPLMIGRSDTATYAATTALAFPDAGIDWVATMPTLSTAAIHRERIEVRPFRSPASKVAHVLPWGQGAQRVLDQLSEGEPKGLGALTRATADLWPTDSAPQKAMMVYEILRGLYAEGRIAFDDVRVPGAIEGMTAPSRRARLVE